MAVAGRGCGAAGAAWTPICNWRRARLCCVGAQFGPASLDGAVEGGRVKLRRLELAAGAVRAAASGTLGEGGRIADGRLDIQAPSATALAELVPARFVPARLGSPGDITRFWRGPASVSVQASGPPEALALRGGGRPRRPAAGGAAAGRPAGPARRRGADAAPSRGAAAGGVARPARRAVLAGRRLARAGGADIGAASGRAARADRRRAVRPDRRQPARERRAGAGAASAMRPRRRCCPGGWSPRRCRCRCPICARPIRCRSARWRAGRRR